MARRSRSTVTAAPVEVATATADASVVAPVDAPATLPDAPVVPNIDAPVVPSAAPVSRWRVVETRRVSWFGHLTFVHAGTIVSVNEYGPDGVLRLKEQGVVLEPLV